MARTLRARRWLFLSAVALMLASSRAVATPKSGVDALVARAHAQGLAEAPLWRRLLHVEAGWFSDESQPDGAAFFLSPAGKQDAGVELDATLRAFFDSAGVDDMHALCRFPARLAWLSQQLGIDHRTLPRARCSKFERYVRDLRAESLTLVFSAYYLNSPASAFGHTFLRVDKRALGGARQELLDYGVDFSADVDTTNPFVYAVKGLAGFFPGRFHRLPYFYKVREYNDAESRDLWEYELALDPRQRDFVIAHLWELGQTHFDYYFLDENCSYHVLSVLEVASPHLELLRHVGLPVLPADTVKALYRNPGLVRRVRYRPSARTTFRARARLLSADEARVVNELVVDADAALPLEGDAASKARVLDAALDLFDVEHARVVLARTDRTLLEHRQRLLERRAAIVHRSPAVVVPTPSGQAPETGHGSSRLGLGSGHASRGGAFHALEYRVALHDLADAGDGYPDTMALEFGRVGLRYAIASSELSVQSVGLFRSLSLNPVDRFEREWSWTVRAGAERLWDAGCEDCLAPGLSGGLGLAASALGGGFTGYALAGVELSGASGLTGGVLGHALRAGVGGEGGLRLLWTRDVVTLFEARAQGLPLQTPGFVWDTGVTSRWRLARDVALRLGGRVQPRAWSAELGTSLYF